MKKFVAIALVAVMAGVAGAANLVQGTQELSLSGMLDFDTVNKTYYDIAAGYGYFFFDGFEAGAKATYAADDAARMWSFKFFGEYNFDLTEMGMIPQLVPYLGLSFGVGGASYDFTITEYTTVQDAFGQQTVEAVNANYNDRDTGVLVGGEAGAKLFVTDDFALTLAFLVDMCSGAIYPSDDGLKKVDGRLQLGMRYYF